MSLLRATAAALLVVATVAAACAKAIPAGEAAVAVPPPTGTPADAAAAAPQAASVDGLALHLVTVDGLCVVEVPRSGRPLRLASKLPAPCQFHRDRAGQPRTVRHGKEQRLLMESSRPHPTSAGDCITKVRGIAVTGRRARLSPHTSTVAACPPFQWDEAMFMGVFE